MSKNGRDNLMFMIDKSINYTVKEFNISVGEIIGVLEVVKLSYANQMWGHHHEELDDNDSGDEDEHFDVGETS